MGWAQGIPTFDGTELEKNLAILQQMAIDGAVQDKKANVEAELLRVKEEQLATLEQIRSALSIGATDWQSMEGGGDNGAETVYPVVNGGPMDDRLFGSEESGRQTVEAMIVQVAAEFANAPGVAAAGLTATQWRCLFQALIKQESRFHITICSPVGACGLTQLMPGTAAEMGVTDRNDPIQNLRGGARYITIQLARFKSIPLALAAYNAGPGAVLKYGGIPPYKETQGYVKSVLRFQAEYLAVIGGPDAMGSLLAGDAGLAEWANTSDASSYHAAESAASAEQVIARLQSIIEQIDSTAGEKAAWDLNTYARAELARIVAMRLRTKAASGMAMGAANTNIAAVLMAERKFQIMGVE